ncbi:MAG: hypothetical protein DCF25_11345 [Leptolyngbya foveolarum]|uniref:Uncharacterized protein n=1 Tax=Leptolyngbya foveolarum TaxID=47253 RepID=A0A2W4W5E1_9CYAN|nr:MAG: hypothetical protein DCF25_11345 [Leptolyngbya foveolarum]
MDNLATSSSSTRVKVDTTLSIVEVEALQHLLKQLTLEECRRLASNDAEAQIFINAAGKLRRQLEAAEELPQMPAYDD